MTGFRGSRMVTGCGADRGLTLPQPTSAELQTAGWVPGELKDRGTKEMGRKDVIHSTEHPGGGGCKDGEP